MQYVTATIAKIIKVWSCPKVSTKQAQTPPYKKVEKRNVKNIFKKERKLLNLKVSDTSNIPKKILIINSANFGK